MKVSFALLFTVLCLFTVALANDNIPECNHLECPQYTLLNYEEELNIDIREYQSARWVRTNIDSFYYDVAVNIGFNRLFNYISGSNAMNETIDMTAPVSVEVIPGAGPFCETTFIVSFFVPEIYQAPNQAPPAPTNSEVYLQTMPDSTKAVYMFPGRVRSWEDLIDPINELTSYLDSENISYVPNRETTAGYDSPFKSSNRHNEIWIDIFDY